MTSTPSPAPAHAVMWARYGGSEDPVLRRCQQALAGAGMQTRKRITRTLNHGHVMWLVVINP